VVACVMPPARKGASSLHEGTTRPLRFLATGMLSVAVVLPLASAPVVKERIVALERSIQPTPVTVYFASNHKQQQLKSSAATVGDFLHQRGIEALPEDAVQPSLGTPLADGLRVSYRPAVPVTLRVRGVMEKISTSASTVGALLAQRNVTLSTSDYVLPREDREIHAGDLVRVVHVSRWVAHERETAKPVTEHRLSLNLPPLASKTIAHGFPGVREKVVQYTRYDNNRHIDAKVLESHVVRPGKPKIVLSGVVAYDRYARFAKRKADEIVRFANEAFSMLATAYDPHCYGCSGTTAVGLPAGFGIVAVDPRVIPLGTRLYVEGYGPALAGDTGGAIKGYRIDLGFNTYTSAINFGERPVRVFVLK
jgi:3D (Asp-Asp-Asp) domain-containing protein/uncharacterized protein YabE (DUF348 family)